MKAELEAAHQHAAQAVGQVAHMLVKKRATKRQVLDALGKLDSAGLELKKVACRLGDGG